MTRQSKTDRKTAWVVSEGSPGHDSQSKGLASALAELLPLDVYTVRGRATVRGWMRPFVRAWMGRSGRPLSRTLLRWFTDAESAAQGDIRPPGGADLVISSGGKSVFAARTFAARHGVPYVYLGEQKRFPNGWFDVIVSPVPDDPRPNAVRTELLPTPVSPRTVEQAAAAHARPDGRLWAAVIGGASRSHRYQPEDWRQLAQSMNALADREGIRWLITTSRRTGAEAETILRETIPQKAVADAIWWSEKPRRELHAFLGMAEIAFVTQDSVTMVTEAVASGRPVVVLQPRDVRFPADSFMSAYLERLETNRRLVRVSVHDARSFASADQPFSPVTQNAILPLAEQVTRRLRWT